MTDQPKPLSETHPTLWEYTEFARADKEIAAMNMMFIKNNVKAIQSCTVDVAEHERVKELVHVAGVKLVTAEVEVERLKQRELDLCKVLNEQEVVEERLKKAFDHAKEQNKNLVDLVSHNGEIAFHNGVVEGERREKERTKEAVEHIGKVVPSTIPTLWLVIEELGLGDEVKP